MLFFRTGVASTLCDLTGLNVVTATYDLDMSAASDIGIVISGKSDAVNTVKIAVLACNDIDATSPSYAAITACTLDATTNLALVPDASGDVVVPIGATNTTSFWTVENIPASRVRLRVTVATPDADNALKIAAFRR